ERFMRAAGRPVGSAGGSRDHLAPRRDAMANDWDSAVCPHGDLVPLAENLWWMKSAQKGMPLPRNMIVYRLASGDLVLHSVVCMDATRMAALERLGHPRYMIVPSEGHRTDA